MFEKKSDIRAALEEAELAPFAAAVERLCAPAACFVDEAVDVAGGLSRLGGAPDLPGDQVWPVRAAYPDGQAIAGRLIWHPELRNAFTLPARLHFVAQIDLEAVARTGVLQKRLPGHGRLLFFWDTRCGAWIDSGQSCRVLWDRSPVNVLTPRDAPTDLTAPDDDFPRLLPARAIALVGVLTVPEHYLLQDLARRAGEAALAAALDSDDLAGRWNAFREKNPPWRLTSGRPVLPHRLCGWPLPEQDDPRVSAVRSALGIEPVGRKLTPEEREQVLAQMHDWTLLLQLDLNSLSRDGFAEGVVYFVMREADLAAGNFDRVHAIYQQT